MTRIEMQYMDAVIAMNRKMVDQHQPCDVDWEQRRYETAKDVLCAIIQTRDNMKVGIGADEIIKETLDITDKFINELLKS